MGNILYAGLITGAVVLISVGIIQPLEDEVRWLICLWLSAPLIGLAIWMRLPALPSGLARTITNTGLIIIIGFVMLSLQLLRQQVVRADEIYHYVAIGTDGSSTSNVRPVLHSQRILRGRMVDRKGVVLVDSQGVNGFAQRIYPVAERYDLAAFSHLIGFSVRVTVRVA